MVFFNLKKKKKKNKKIKKGVLLATLGLMEEIINFDSI